MKSATSTHSGDGAAGMAAVPAPRLARAILLVVLGSFLVMTMLNLGKEHIERGPFILAVIGLTAIFALQLRHSAPGASQAPRRQRVLTLSLQAALTYLPLIVYHWAWGAMAGFLAGSLLLLLSGRVAWPLFALVGVTMLVYPLTHHIGLGDTFYMCESSLLTGLMVFGLSRLAELVSLVHATRGELARMAVANERLRFARDLHDLLGYSLSAVTLKSELIRRTLRSHPDRAEEEVTAVLDISRQALADVRLVASGYRDMNLEQECASARSVLRAAEVEAEVTVSVDEVDPRVETVLATVLREGVTNVLRHSTVRRCTVEAVEKDGVVRLAIVNDGVRPGYKDPAPNSGSGLGNLALRVGAVGGSLTAGVRDGGRFHLVAEAPVKPTGQLGVMDGATEHHTTAATATAA
ncbi:sensor histidine kinase [Streptomyces sp. NPDC001262]|uniref:sensor histidine kinase n=1 Tax=Streptomyces TaxID=1883 RepID=UPI0036749F94